MKRSLPVPQGSRLSAPLKRPSAFQIGRLIFRCRIGLSPTPWNQRLRGLKWPRFCRRAAQRQCLKASVQLLRRSQARCQGRRHPVRRCACAYETEASSSMIVRRYGAHGGVALKHRQSSKGCSTQELILTLFLRKVDNFSFSIIEPAMNVLSRRSVGDVELPCDVLERERLRM